MPELSKNAQLLKFFSQQYGHPGVPRKRLVKLAFMADVLSRQYLGKPISSFVYIKDHFGPNARELPQFTGELATMGLSFECTERDGVRTTIRLQDSGQAIEFGFSRGETEILGYVVKNYLTMDIGEFIDAVVKKTEPFLAATFEGEELPMSMIDGSGREQVGFDLEAILAAEHEAIDGKGSTLAEFSRALRADLTAGRPN